MDNTSSLDIVGYFPEKGELFNIGFQAGEIFYLLKLHETRIAKVVNPQSVEVIKEMCKEFQYKCEVSNPDPSGMWVTVILTSIESTTLVQ